MRSRHGFAAALTAAALLAAACSNDPSEPVPADAGALRLQVTFAGIRPEDGQLYAIYAR